MNLENVLGQINADCGNLHGVAPLISRLRHLHYGALRRRLEQEPSTPSALGRFCGKTTCCERSKWSAELIANAFLIRLCAFAAVREDLCQFTKVLGGGSEQEFVICSAWAT